MQTYGVEEEARLHPRNRNHGKIRRLIEKYARLIKVGKFAAAGAIGFLDTEIILVLGSLLFYGRLSPLPSASGSLAFWALNAIAFGIGVTVAFLVNEMLIPSFDQKSTLRLRLWELVERLVKFQLIFLTGNTIIVLTQLILLRQFSIPPFFGNIIGAVVSFPASYFFSMHYVWNSNGEKKNRVENRSSRRDEYKMRIKDVQKILRRFPALTSENYNMKVNEYRLDIIPQDENQTVIDFALNLEVITSEQ